MKSITTKFRPCTDTTGARILATCEGGKVLFPYDHGKDAEGNHDAAASKLRAKMGWHGRMARGMLPDGKSRVYVFVDWGGVDGCNLVFVD